MIESGSGRPGGLLVTRGALPARELAPVLVGVAVGAAGPQAQVGASQVDACRCELLSLLVQPGLVAVLADEASVPAFEVVSGLTVVEGRAARLAPPDQLELRALMLDVAGLAVLVLRSSMKAPSAADPIAEGPVAVQALLGDDAAPRLVTASALTASLESGVGTAELAGRDLGERGKGPQSQPDGDRRRSQGLRRHEAPQAYPVHRATATWSSMKTYITTAKGLCATCQ